MKTQRNEQEWLQEFVIEAGFRKCVKINSSLYETLTIFLNNMYVSMTRIRCRGISDGKILTDVF
jgi:hypothetical protein